MSSHLLAPAAAPARLSSKKQTKKKDAAVFRFGRITKNEEQKKILNYNFFSGTQIGSSRGTFIG